MKSKLLLPLVAIVFALASAFAYRPLTPQTAWFHVPATEEDPATAEEGEINTPSTASVENPCTTSLTTACQIDGEIAYESATAATNQTQSAVLKYNAP